MTIRCAHYAEFAPNKTGLYGTTKDLIMAERSVGIDAVFIDSHVVKGKIISRPDLKDGDLPIVKPEWAKTADVLVHHSIIHKDMRNRGIPMVLAIHGRPESTFLLEHREMLRKQYGRIYSATTNHGEDHRYKAFFTFWEPYMFHLGLQVPKDKLFYVPAMVDLQKFSPVGKTSDFIGSPRILIADMWRHDVTPFNVLMAAARFKEKYAPEAKIHVVGGAPMKTSMKTLTKILKGTLAEVHPLVENIALVYRSVDMVVTPHNIATRVVRESLACGTPIVAGSSNPYTPFTADSRDANAFAAEIHKCWTWIKAIEKKQVVAKVRGTAEREFNPNQAGLAAKAIIEKVVGDNKPKWTKQGKLDRKAYPTYEAYIKEQKSKLDEGIPFLADYDKRYRVALRERLEKLSPRLSPWRGKKVLCLGARIGTEVRSFLDVGCFAFGIDLNPGKDNSYVVTGDFHKLGKYADSSVDVVFTNSLDHVYRIQYLLKGIARILDTGGFFIVELEGPKDRDADKWASLHWNNQEDLISLFKQFNLHLESQSEFDTLWRDCPNQKQLVFQLKKGGE
jgi:glycosyltransferase involved in cell wall biosynthesis/SAM-dependent methyltransferase